MSKTHVSDIKSMNAGKKWIRSCRQLRFLFTCLLPSAWHPLGRPWSSRRGTEALGADSEAGDQKGHRTSREYSSNEGFDLCYFSVIPAEPRVPRIPLVLFRDTHDDSMENQETWALSYAPIPNDILSQLISILIETWKWGNDRYEAQHELPGRTLPSNTALSLHHACEARVHGQE